MLRYSLLTLAAASISLFAFRPSAAHAATQLSGPLFHENLAVYFIHGPSNRSAIPLTLEEALAKGFVKVHETGEVRQLEIENLGDVEVFVNAGEIVKGGRQDRALTASLTLPPRSGRVPIAAFCVERSRWSKRGAEDETTFASAPEALPSLESRLAMRYSQVVPAPGSHARDPQSAMWDSVASIQQNLQASLGESVASPESQSSLQLALENETLQKAKEAYVEALRPAGEEGSDIVGFVFAINGKLNSADVYPSNGLFRKLWPKLLNASVTEAIANRDGESATAPTLDAVSAFITAAEQGQKTEQTLSADVVLDSRVSSGAIYSESRSPKAGWMHRNYLAR